MACSHSINEYGMRRYNSFGLKKYSVDCLQIDNNSIFDGYYKLVKPKIKDDKITKDGLRNNFLVFYKDGKVANFLDQDESDFDFNPKKAEMGYFGIKNEKCFLKFKVKSLGGYKIMEENIVFINNDSLITYTVKSSTSSGFYSKYIKINSDKIINQPDPDW
jgi:hypothetical protein